MKVVYKIRMSCSCVYEAEHFLMQFLRSLNHEDLKRLYTGYDVERILDEETEAEMKEAVWRLYTRQKIRWGYVLQKVKEDMVEDESDPEDEENVDSE
jgi:hypothetical protein